MVWPLRRMNKNFILQSYNDIIWPSDREQFSNQVCSVILRQIIFRTKSNIYSREDV